MADKTPAEQALGMARAGVPVRVIAEQHFGGDVDQAIAALTAGLAGRRDLSPADQTRLDLERCEVALSALTPGIVAGDPRAIEQLGRLTDRRDRLAAKLTKPIRGPIRRGVEKALRAAKLGPERAGEVALLQQLADRLDSGSADNTVASYFLASCRALGLAPAQATGTTGKAATPGRGGPASSKVLQMRQRHADRHLRAVGDDTTE